MRYDLADVFTDRPSAGNQLAVFADERPLDYGRNGQLTLPGDFLRTV